MTRKDSYIGILGIDLQTRRRNRVNGKISTVKSPSDASLVEINMNVQQSFGNCPQYIQSRAIVDAEIEKSDGKIQKETFVSESDRQA